MEFSSILRPRWISEGPREICVRRRRPNPLARFFGVQDYYTVEVLIKGANRPLYAANDGMNRHVRKLCLKPHKRKHGVHCRFITLNDALKTAISHYDLHCQHLKVKHGGGGIPYGFHPVYLLIVDDTYGVFEIGE